MAVPQRRVCFVLRALRACVFRLIAVPQRRVCFVLGALRARVFCLGMMAFPCRIAAVAVADKRRLPMNDDNTTGMNHRDGLGFPSQRRVHEWNASATTIIGNEKR